MENKRYTHAVWDFNGTVLDDVDTGIRAVNTLLSERGLRQIASVDEYRRVFGFPIRSYYERLGFDFSVEPYEELAPKWVELYLNFVVDAPLFEGVTDSLALLREKGLGLILLSATEKCMLTSQLASLGLENAFDEVLGLDNIHAYSKVDIAREWRKNAPQMHAFMIGDTEHDVQTAEAMGIDCYLVSGGHQDVERLAATGAPVFDSVKSLMTYLCENGLI